MRFSVWDGWDLIEEYNSSNVRTAAYLQGAQGVIKSLLNNIYYYQDKLGSTTHIANASGQLLESYRYDLYGTPSYFNSTSQPLNSSTYGIVDLYAGERWVSELGLYDLRNRFMSPELGRFLQSDPIGFKGDPSNLYRYCHNDFTNFSDPMGLEDPAQRTTHMLTSWGKGDWIPGANGLSYADIKNHSDATRVAVTGQHSRSGPKEQQGRGSRAPSESDEPLRMLPPKDVTTEGYGRIAYYQLASREGKPLSGGNLKFQEVTRKDPQNTFDIETSDKKPAHELIRGGLFKDGIGFQFKPGLNVPTGSATLYQKFRSEYPDGQRGPEISTQLKQVTTLHADRTVTISVSPIDP